MRDRAPRPLLDLLVKGAVFGSVLLLASFAQLSRNLLVGLLIVLGLCLLFAYDVLFEVLGSGRTPGKRWSGLRVVLDGGRPIGLGASAVRNILRVIDILPGVYGAGLLSVAFTRRNQRLGDLAAGSLVVRERRELGAVPAASASGLGSKHDSTAAREHEWDVSAISADELATVREFLSRRGGCAPDRARTSRRSSPTPYARESEALPRRWPPRSCSRGSPPRRPAAAERNPVGAPRDISCSPLKRT